MSGPCPRPECGGEVHTDGWGNPIQCPAAQTKPLRLTAEELAPVLVALERRHRGRIAGHGILRYPLPHCPSCGAPPTEMTTATAPDFLTDTIAIRFEHCGHAFTAGSEDINEAAQQARRMADAMEQQPAGEPEPPTHLGEPQAVVGPLRNQILRTREAFGADERVAERLRQAEIRAAVAEHEAEAYRNQVQALVRELLRAREVPEEDLPQRVRVIILNEEAP